MAKEEFIILPENTTGIQTTDDMNTRRKIIYLKGGKSRYVSDGYHTFDELYEFRMLYNAALFNEFAAADAWKDQDPAPRIVYNVHKSTKHADGEDCFGGGWFIVVAYLNGQQITNHYKIEHWDLFKVEARERADEWDGHTPADVIKRLTDFVKEGNFERKK